MTRQQKQTYCKVCQRKTLHVKSEVKSGCAGHVVLTLVTCGLWLPIGMLLAGVGSWAGLLAPWHCQTCGKKR